MVFFDHILWLVSIYKGESQLALCCDLVINKFFDFSQLHGVPASKVLMEVSHSS